MTQKTEEMGKQAELEERQEEQKERSWKTFDLLDGRCLKVGQHGAILDGGSPDMPEERRWDFTNNLLHVGSGLQAHVYATQDKDTGTVYALKVLKNEQELRKQMPSSQVQKGHCMELWNVARAISGNKTALTTIDALLRLGSHRNIVNSVQAFYVSDLLYILMEYMDVGSLQDLLHRAGPLSKPVLSFITQQVLHGLQYLHNSKVIHRDIKPGNILINRKGYVKLSDFGVSTFVSHESMIAQTIGVGTKSYMSPERIRGGSYSFYVDVWSVGVTVAECAYGVYPFVDWANLRKRSDPFKETISSFSVLDVLSAGIDFQRVLREIMALPYMRPVLCLNESGTDLLPALKDVVVACLQPNPQDRSTCDQLLQKFPFVTQNEGQKSFKQWLEVTYTRYYKEDGLRNSGVKVGRNITAGSRRAEGRAPWCNNYKR